MNNSMMNTLVSIIPMEIFLEGLETALQEYKLAPTEDILQKVMHGCHGILLKHILNLKGGEKDPLKAAMEMSEEMDTIEKATKFFDTNKN